MKYIEWIKNNTVAILGFIALVLAFFLYRKWKQDQVNSLKDAVKVLDATKEIKALDARREFVTERMGQRDRVLESIDKKLQSNKRVIVEARTGAKDLSDDEIIAEYRRLGYVR